MGFIVYLGLYLSFGLAHAFRLEQRPIYQLFGADGEQFVFAAAFVLAALCWILRAWGAGYLRPEVVWSHDTRADALVIAGPFRYTRNPLYLANFLLVAALSIFGPPLAVPVLLTAFFVFVQALIALEERDLGRRFGAAFERYRQEVPRLLPRLTPAAAPEAAPGRLRSGLLGESLTGCYALSLLILAVFGAYAWRFAFGIALIGILAQRFVQRFDRSPRRLSD